MDAAAGIQYEGEDPPEATPDDAVALRVLRMLSNGMGGIDWAGLPLACAIHSVDDVEMLVHRLVAAKNHRPAVPGAEE